MKTRWLEWVVLVLSASAFAQGKPTLVDFPLDVKAPLPAAQQTELQNDFRMLLARNPAVLLSTKSQWKAALAAHKRQDCDVRDECLQQLATTAGTLYAIYASVEQNAAGTEVTATGRVVNQDRVLVRPRLTFSVPRKGKFNEAARNALAQLIAALELDKLSATLTPPVAPVVTPPIAKDAPIQRPPAEDLVLVVPALPPEQKAGSGTTGARVGAWVVGGLGGAAAGVAAGFGISAITARTTLPLDGQLVDASQARTQAGVNRDATISLVSSIGAAALLGTSVILFITSAPPATPVVSLVPAPGGAQLTLTGEFGP